MSTMTTFDKAALSELINQAEAEGKWLHCHYQDLWFSPAELRSENSAGNFVWGVVNWVIRDPQEQLDRLDRDIEGAVRNRDAFAKRMRHTKRA